MWTRRQLLAGAGAGLLASLLDPAGRRRAVARTPGAAPGKTANRPRYWLCVVPAGGIDAIYTTDPRTRSEVASGVDVPYQPAEIVEAAGMRLGPHFRGLSAWASRLAIVNGVAINTANHHTGLLQMARLRTSTTRWTAAALEIIGEHRDGQALGHMSLGAQFTTAYTPSMFGEPSEAVYGPPKSSLFELLDHLTPEELDLTGRVAAEHAAQLARSGPRSDSARAAAEQASAFLRKAATLPPFRAEAWLPPPLDAIDRSVALAPRVQRALWSFEHDLVATATVFSAGVWDSHTRNAQVQGKLTPYLVAVLDRLFTELERRSNAHGPLSEQTAVLVASEIGRFPYLNQADGKDHYPQISVLLYGRPFRSGTFGDTGKQLEGLPVSSSTGRAGGADPAPLRLDDVGTTALLLSGIDPEKHGFTGRRLDFVVEA
jgi:uncharacterized protein (DUF1501 family)